MFKKVIIFLPFLFSCAHALAAEPNVEFNAKNNQADIFNPNVVKCVFGKNGKALLFSRSPIPYLRNEKKENWSISNFYKHIGMYAFRRSTLLKITKLAISRLEELESLEQLRWLENGIEIYTTELPFDSFGIDTPEDLQKAEDFLKKSD